MLAERVAELTKVFSPAERLSLVALTVARMRRDDLGPKAVGFLLASIYAITGTDRDYSAGEEQMHAAWLERFVDLGVVREY